MSSQPEEERSWRFRWGLRFLKAFFLLVLAGGVYLTFLAVTNAYIAQRGPRTLVYQHHGFRRVTLAPNQQYRHGEVAFSVNNQGTRGTVPGSKPPNKVRIIAIGGSSVFDHWLGEGWSWPEQLGPRLSELGFSDVESFNAGIPGYSSRESLAFYYDRLRYFDPDLVILYQGWNDAKYMAAFERTVDVDGFYRYKDLSRYRFLTAQKPLRNWYALREMIGIPFRDELPLAEALPPTPRAGRGAGRPAGGSDFQDPEARWRSSAGMAFWRGNVETFVRQVLADGGLPVLVPQVTLVHANLDEAGKGRVRYDFVKLSHEDLLAVNEVMVQVLAEVAEKYGIPFIDLRSEMNGRLSLLADQVHLRPLGSQQLARRLAEELVPVLEGMGREPVGATAPGPQTLAYWRFEEAEEEIRDEGPFGLHGKAVGGTQWRAEGKEGSCRELDGRKGEIVIPSSGFLHLGQEFRIEAWINLQGRGKEGSQGLVVKGGAYHLALRDGRPAFFGYGLEPEGWLVAPDSVPKRGWHQVAAEYVRGEVILFLDGEVVLVSAVQGEVQPSSRPLRIGGGNGSFQGLVDEVRLEALVGEAP